MDFKTGLFISDIICLTVFVLLSIAYFFGIQRVYQWVNDPKAGFWKQYFFLAFFCVSMISGVSVVITPFEDPTAKEAFVYFSFAFKCFPIVLACIILCIRLFTRFCWWLYTLHCNIIEKRG